MIASKLRIAIPPINFVVYIIIPQVVLIVVYYSYAKIMHRGDKPLDSQSIIALVCAVGGAIGGLVYFLTGSIKNTVDAAIKDILESLEEQSTIMLDIDYQPLKFAPSSRLTVDYSME